MRIAAKGTSEVVNLCYSSARAGMSEWDMDAFIDRAFSERGLHH